MPPKRSSKLKKKDKKDKKKQELETVVDPQIPSSLLSLHEKDLDLITDLNDDFFARGNKVICKPFKFLKK